LWRTPHQWSTLTPGFNVIKRLFSANDAAAFDQ
jgi:hypothetical protein